MFWYGDTTKGYRLYDPEKDRVIYSRDVRFDETEKTKLPLDSGSTMDSGVDSDKLVIDFDSDHEADQEVPNQESNEEHQPPEEPEPVRKSTRERRQPNYLWERKHKPCLLYTSPSPRDATLSRMPSSA